MRPVLRGTSPRAADFENYRDAFGDLVGRIGMYCSYCERRIATELAVEHIEPKKGPYGRPELKGRWDNFLLACKNCNSTKSDQKVVLADLLLPDRDNTAFAYDYGMDGSIVTSLGLPPPALDMARETLRLTGLDRHPKDERDANGRLVAKQRFQQRMEVWAIAEECKREYLAKPCDEVRRMVVQAARGFGFFSVWMAVFADDVEVRTLLIKAFAGTAVDCYDERTQVVSPRPTNGLANGSKA